MLERHLLHLNTLNLPIVAHLAKLVDIAHNCLNGLALAGLQVALAAAALACCHMMRVQHATIDTCAVGVRIFLIFLASDFIKYSYFFHGVKIIII